MRKNSYILLYTLNFSPILSILYTTVFHLPKTISHFFAFLILIFGIIFCTIRNKINIPSFSLYIFIFAIYNAIWILILNLDRYLLTNIYYAIIYFSTFFIVIIVYNTNYTDKFIKYSIVIFKITLLIGAIVSIIQVFNVNFLNEGFYFRNEEELKMNEIILYQFRRHSIFGFIGAQAIGLAFMPLLSIVIGYLLKTKNKFYFLFLLLGGIIAFLTNSRYIIIGFIIITFQILTANKIKLKGYITYIIYFLIISFLLYYVLKYLGYDFKQWYNTRLFSEGSIKNTTRYNAFYTFIKFFPESPIFGIGYQTEEIKETSRILYGSSHIHVGYLSHLVNYGIFGCFFLYGFWFLLLKRLYKTAKLTSYWGSFFGFLTFLWSFATMSQSSILYYGLVFVMVFDKYFYNKYLLERNQK